MRSQCMKRTRYKPTVSQNQMIQEYETPQIAEGTYPVDREASNELWGQGVGYVPVMLTQPSKLIKLMLTRWAMSAREPDDGMRQSQRGDV